MIDKNFKLKNPREAAFKVLLFSLREELFVSYYLEQWRKESKPISQDYHLIQEIVYGSLRMSMALDYIAAKLADKEKLSLKLREKVLLRQAIYQFYFMDRVPIYAITNETVTIAKKYCHETFVKFLNAILRKLPETAIKLPEGNTVPDLSTKFSYPPFFVQELLDNYGLEKSLTVLEAGNKPPVTMFRVRGKDKPRPENTELLAGIPMPVGVVKDSVLIPEIAQSLDFYIQNVTPVVLIDNLAKGLSEPTRILDLCSSPGGKLLLVHDLFPKAEFFANDVSPEKLKNLTENIQKYDIKANLSCSKGEEFTSDEKFDIVILDVPCSNTGVLNKRPEARFRLSKKEMEQLEQIQLKLLKNAQNLIKSGGEIWYLTCSVLKSENEYLVRQFAESNSFVIHEEQSILPNTDGWDGGYACSLKKKS